MSDQQDSTEQFALAGREYLDTAHAQEVIVESALAR
jgi:hypothetical protein